MVRFLGATPTSSNIHQLLTSICQQLCYNGDVPIEDVPHDFVPLKNYFKVLLEKVSKKFFILILLGKQLRIRRDEKNAVSPIATPSGLFFCCRRHRDVFHRLSSERGDFLDPQMLAAQRQGHSDLHQR